MRKTILRVGSLSALLAVGASGGCVEQEMVVESEPSGALVYANDQEVGRTPISRPFIWYGNYDVVVRKEGYETLRTGTPVIAPVWQWVPFDFVAEILPIRLTDRHTVKYELKPETESAVDPQQVILRGREMQSQLESGQNPPTTRPAK